MKLQPVNLSKAAHEKRTAPVKKITHLSNRSITKATQLVNRLNEDLLKYISNR